jgi:alkanesulfonate monooxygenase SsuD/methylene tetrahydromethanopterin reductase-like flavin-dependent oxidoreductase (luciferase family)
MEFGLFSNGFRPHTTAAETFEEDLQEIVLADELDFRAAWISEHHGEPVYIDKVDTLPIPELLMCKIAGLTRRIRMGPAVKIIHLYHPVDTALTAAVTDHLTGGRYMFGFGSGFQNPSFSQERGKSFEERYPRMLEALALIQKCWTAPEPFDWDGQYWQGKGITALPRPLQQPLPIAVATYTEDTIRMAGERGYTLLGTGYDPASAIRAKADIYCRAAVNAGQQRSLDKLSVACFIYVTDSIEQAKDDLRSAVNLELSYQKQRGLLKYVLQKYQLPRPVDDMTFDDLVDLGIYMIGDPDSVAAKVQQFYAESGGFGTLLLVAGKCWADREKRLRSLRLFAEEVRPRLAHLTAEWEPEATATSVFS